MKFNLHLFDATWNKAKEDFDKAISNGDRAGAERAYESMQAADSKANGKLTATTAYSTMESQLSNMKSPTTSSTNGGSKKPSSSTPSQSIVNNSGSTDYSAILNSGLSKPYSEITQDDYDALVEAFNARGNKLTGMTSDPNYSKYMDAQGDYQKQLNDIYEILNQKQLNVDYQKQLNDFYDNQQEMINDYLEQYETLKNGLNNYDFKNTEEYKTLLPIYEEMYRQLGEDARKNTLADAAGLTGGLTNSYALAASQQAANDYNSKFESNVIPQLMDLAYNRYASGKEFELSNLNSAQSLLSQMANADQNYLNNLYNLNRINRSDYESDRNFNEGVRQYDEGIAYQKERDKVADEQWLKSFEEGVREYEKSYGLSLAKANSSSSSKAATDEQKANAKQIALAAFNEALRYDGDPIEWLRQEYSEKLPITTASILGVSEINSGLTNGDLIAQGEYGDLVMEELLSLIKDYQGAKAKKDYDNITISYS